MTKGNPVKDYLSQRPFPRDRLWSLCHYPWQAAWDDRRRLGQRVRRRRYTHPPRLILAPCPHLPTTKITTMTLAKLEYSCGNFQLTRVKEFKLVSMELYSACTVLCIWQNRHDNTKYGDRECFSGGLSVILFGMWASQLRIYDNLPRSRDSSLECTYQELASINKIHEFMKIYRYLLSYG